ncbi:hypothetical protein MNBD_PLANCTO02-2864 [hydrothermal vent metagenome]|uniref:Uncharacterized protein n=1 Tax=hydrothermal vent metagenome TaxID=652676 RepID=A0A3B1DYQ2_9ZZZZ
MIFRITSFHWLILATCTSLFCSSLNAQSPNGRYYPVDQSIPGKAGYWAAAIGKYNPRFFQPIRFDLPSTGMVTVYQGEAKKSKTIKSSAQAGLRVGPLYRLKISQMPEYPGLELYPTIELLDRLHPPHGKAHEFPVPVQFTKAEIEEAQKGRLITKVIYLEHPRVAIPRRLKQPREPRTLPTSVNLLKEADHQGRPMAIVRLGGRIPNLHGNEDVEFFGTPQSISLTYKK